MKTLVAFYSRTGNTRKAGMAIAKNLKADADEIIDAADRSGIIGWLKAGRDAMKGYDTKIKSGKDPSRYDLVVIGTPVWAATVVPAIRAYLSRNKFRKVAFFCTYGGSRGKTFEEMDKLCGKPSAVLGLKDSELVKDTYSEAIAGFCRELESK